jgi:hypothetical protein
VGSQAGGGCGATALRQRPAPCVPTLRQWAMLPPHDGETPCESGRLPCGTPDRPAQSPRVPPRPLLEPGQGRTAWRAEGVPLKT